MSYPYLARTTLKYKSPHATDLSFAKDETIRVTGPSLDDEDWLVGETLDGTKKGGFPKDFIIPIDDSQAEVTSAPAEPVAATHTEPEQLVDPTAAREEASPPPVPATAATPPSPKLDIKPLPTSAAATPAAIASPAPQAVSGDADSPPHRSMKDRLAFFNAAQTKTAPPPPVKPKPAVGGLTWSQRQKLRQEQEAKEREAIGESGPIAAAPPAPAPSAATEEKKEEGAGMSAADAQTSISKGGSLKERMAALQGAGAFGAPAPKPPPPKPSGKVWTRPPAPPQPEPEDEEGAEATLEKAKSPTAEEADPMEQPAAEEQDADEQTEEEQEKARRAAIAARMAKLGARAPMGMPPPPPKPARKPTREAGPVISPAEEKPEPALVAEDPVPSTLEPVTSPVSETPTSPPASVTIPAIPRRTAGPRRRGGASSAPSAKEVREDPPNADQRFERIEGGEIIPPPQVMVKDEEKPLPKTESQLELEKEQEEAGRGPHGAEGARVAGIAMMDDQQAEDYDPDTIKQPVVGVVGKTESESRGIGTITDRKGEGNIVDGKEAEPEGLEEGMAEGGDEKDEIMREAEAGMLEVEYSTDIPEPVMVPIHPPAKGGPEIDEEEETPPPPPPRMTDVPKDEIELKHEHDEQAQEQEAVENEELEQPSLPTPPWRFSTDKPAGPRPLPVTPGKSPAQPAPENTLPPPPVGNPMIPPRDEEEEEPEAQGEDDGDEEEEEPAPSPPPRKASIPAPVQVGVPIPAGAPQSPVSPASPPVAPPVAPDEDKPAQDDEETSRRSGIAARMAKLGGIKFGMPPPTFKKLSAAGTEESRELRSPVQETPTSPELDAPASRIQVSEDEPVKESATGKEGQETPEQEAARRRATLARLRAGGTLGFGMFNHGPTAEPQPDQRGIEEEEAPTVPPGLPAPEPADEKEDEVPPRHPPRPLVPGGRPMPPLPAHEEVPPPPARRESISRPIPPPPAEEDDVAPPPPARPEVPQLPIRSPSGRRPPVPSTERRLSQQAPQPAVFEDVAPVGPPRAPGHQIVDEPTVILEDETDERDILPPPPPRPAPQIQTQFSTPPPAPRRSVSNASRSSRTDTAGFSPTTRQSSRLEPASMPSPPPQVGTPMAGEPRPSFSQNRPGFNELQGASRDAGARLARAAKGMFDQGRKAYFGDGSPPGFVLLAMDNAQLPRPQQTWGQVVFEQESSSVLKRYDEPRPGDIAAFHDAKLKGKKGLQSYTQQVGSVEDPLVGVVIEFEGKKHKLRVLQVERGVPEEVSYRCDDLKSGRVVVYRPGF